MTAEQRIAKRLQRLAADARRVGVALVADADASAIRVMSTAELRTATDLRAIGQTAAIDGGCGGGVPPQRTGSGN